MFRGCTFEEQQVNSKDDGGLYREIFRKDGVLWGCEMTVTNDTLTIQPGRLIISGREIRVDGATQIPFTGPIQNGYGQVVLTIDLSKTATKEEFDQVEASVVYSTTSLFPELTQGEINTSNGDMVYQQELAVVSIAGGNITGITRQIGDAEIDAEKLGGQPPEYYATKARMDVIGNASLNFKGSLVGSGYDLNAYFAPDKVGIYQIASAGNSPTAYGTMVAMYANGYAAQFVISVTGVMFARGKSDAGAISTWKTIMGAGDNMTSTHLSTISTAGVYGLLGSNIASGAPVDGAYGTLFVQTSMQYITNIFVSVIDGTTYSRGWNGAVWSPWKVIG